MLGMVAGFGVLVGAMACGGEAPRAVGIESESASELRGALPLQNIGASEHASARIDRTHRRLGFVFRALKDQQISIFSDGLHGFDTALRLFAFSTSRGRPVGRPLAANDDTARSDWTDNPTSSSIDAFTLPRTGAYAIVLEPSDRSTSGDAVVWFDLDLPAFSSPPAFSGSGDAVPLGFQGVQAVALPVSSTVTDFAALASDSNRFVVARIGVDPSALQAILADPGRLGAFAFDCLYHAGTTPLPGPVIGAPGAANVYPLSAADALGALQAATPVPRCQRPRVRDAEHLLLDAMLADGNFSSSAVHLLRVHWDNADDASADGILAIDDTTGELRLTAYAQLP
jgi:hypothetical protein